jgi:hypothetical protein
VKVTLYHFIENAKVHGLDQYYYLRFVLTMIPTMVPEIFLNFLPLNIERDAFGELTFKDALFSLDSIPIA